MQFYFLLFYDLLIHCAAASIEERLREMQRKLSEIAEIPKILSSTLATVSQTFDKLMPTDAEQLKLLTRRVAQQRKLSYDEDAVDYELSDNEHKDEDKDDVDEDEEDEYDSKLVDNVAEQIKCAKVKEITPESDYASEVNNLESEEYEDDDDDDDDDYELSMEDDDVIDDDDDTDVHAERNNNDFFSTSYTWNLCNVPKLSVNDELQEKLEYETEVDSDNQLQKKPRGSPTQEDVPKQEKQEKLDKLERCWPWADREKIIYKQSTCHLVPRKPLGIIEQRIQLLAKKQLVDNLKQMEQQQQQQELENK